MIVRLAAEECFKNRVPVPAINVAVRRVKQHRAETALVAGQSRGAAGSGFRKPISKAEIGADFPALVPALVHFGKARIGGAKRVFVSSNGVDHSVGCFHKDGFLSGFCWFEPWSSLNDAKDSWSSPPSSYLSIFQMRANDAKLPNSRGCGLNRAGTRLII